MGILTFLRWKREDFFIRKLHKAAARGNLSKVKMLSKKHDFNQPDKDNRTPLHIACAFGHADIVHFLGAKNAELNLLDNKGRTPLVTAVEYQQEHCVVELLDHNANPNLADINGNTALHLTAMVPSIPLAELLLRHGASINAKNKKGCTPLFVAAAANHTDVVSYLLSKGADVNASDNSSRTPLMIAANNGYFLMISMLLWHFADDSIKDNIGRTADDHAVMNRHYGCSDLIINRGTRGRPPQSPSRRKAKGAKLLSRPIRARSGLTVEGPAVDREEDETSIHNVEPAEALNEADVRQELADALQKLSTCEASLEVSIHCRKYLEEEKKKDMDRVKRKLQKTMGLYIQSKQHIHDLKNALESKQCEVIFTSQKLQKVLSSSTAAEMTIKQLQERVMRYVRLCRRKCSSQWKTGIERSAISV
ncbi:ankyrin repeat domain-containing protein 7-like [Amia ocellicauda]|uniref:ankyrin repeat domain-containing protein 7-like n=1 Tax=Amia ocellicauda TaxID=2972642 RepID=UPI0034643556